MAIGRLQIGRLNVSSISFDDAIEQLVSLARSARSAYVVTPNADHVVRAEKDDEFVTICDAADLVLADGMPLIWISWLLRRPLPSKISGSDVMPALASRAAKEGLKIFLLGGVEREAEAAAENLVAKNPGLVVAGTYSPPFGFEKDTQECERIVALLNESGAHIVFVGVGSPKQERWIATWRHRLRAGVLLGVGASIAFAAGTKRRAPQFMQATGTEWLFRLTQEPKRLARRYLHDLKIFGVAWRSYRRLPPT